MRKIYWELQIGLIIATMLMGCQGGGGTTYVENNTTDYPASVPTDGINITGTNDVQLTDDNSIIVECGGGGCGDITIYKKRSRD